MTCIITGCALVDDTHQRAAWGDLYRIGEVWIFNANVIRGEVAWQTDEDFVVPNVIKQLCVKPTCPAEGIFERRGVVVVHSDWAELNKAALDYLKGG